MAEFDIVADRLASLRLAGARAGSSSDVGVATPSEGYAVQASTIRGGRLGTVVGWKNGPSKRKDFEGFGLSEPGTAPLFSRFLHDSGAVLPGCTGDAARHRLIAVEAEIGFVMASPLPARSSQAAPYTEQEVWAAVGEVVCAIEVCGNRLGFDGATPAQLVADCTNNVGVVLGTRVPRSALQGVALESVPVAIEINGRASASGTGASGAVDDRPLSSLAWLANFLSRDGASLFNGRHLERGDVVVSGACCLTQTVRPGDRFRCVFEGLGDVEMRVAGSRV